MTVVLVTDHPAPTVDVEREELARIGAQLVVAPSGAEEELVVLVKDADAILTCFKQVTPRVIQAASRLRVIGRYGVGVDNIAVAEATRRGIPVTNVPTYCVDEVAEHVIALLYTLARKITAYDSAVRRGGWELNTGVPIHRLAGSTLGIVGFGQIGHAVASRALGLGMQVLVSDPNVSGEHCREIGVESTSLVDLLERSDQITLHVPLDSTTHHLIDATRLAHMKRGAFLINASRGGIVDGHALAEALEAGRLAGAGLDVFEPERLETDHPLFGAPRVVMTPHVAFYSEESIEELQRQATRNVVAILSGSLPSTVVNREVLSLPQWAHVTRS